MKKKNTYSLSTTNIKKGKLGNPMVLPKHIRNNPFADLPPISEK